jgi:hypothetical protein
MWRRRGCGTTPPRNTGTATHARRGIGGRGRTGSRAARSCRATPGAPSPSWRRCPCRASRLRAAAPGAPMGSFLGEGPKSFGTTTQITYASVYSDIDIDSYSPVFLVNVNIKTHIPTDTTARIETPIGKCTNRYIDIYPHSYTDIGQDKIRYTFTHTHSHTHTHTHARTHTHTHTHTHEHTDGRTDGHTHTHIHLYIYI